MSIKEIEYENGLLYVGEVDKEDCPHGMGKMTGVDGMVGEGGWVNGAMHGEGKMIIVKNR